MIVEKFILIGKTGGLNLRADRPIGTETLFKTMDAMPMGRAEMKRRRWVQ